MSNEITNITQLPFFIIFKIANYLRDTDSYNNFRSSCKAIYECIHYLRSFYESGALRSSVKIYHHMPIGNKELYYESGNIMVSYTLRGFKYHGLCREYYETGIKQAEYRYYLNKKDGCYFEYHRNGMISISERYYRGKRDGISYFYYENGIPRQENRYVDGKRHGVFKQYLSNGEQILEKSYKEGNLHGLYREWKNGMLITLGCYMYGNLENEWVEYFPNGTIRLKKNYLDGKQHGNEITYYSNGKIKQIKRFILGKQNGVEKCFYRGGQLKYIERWKEGAKYGIAKYYSYPKNIIKTIDYFYNNEMYTCIENTTNTKRVEEFNTSFGHIKIDKLRNLYSISIYTGDFSYEYELIHDDKTEYTRFYFMELDTSAKENTLEYMIYRDLNEEFSSKTLKLNNKFKIRKLRDMIYHTIITQHSQSSESLN